ncbi:hypothetical protein B0H63DRAFT_467895 [Podospora didyma]|uniref:Azaphilone pigments biosynthesis cluster protein L N-terminal domain-containing protein n=1 Tax=Podospora didyma TaxID=330526 RepID=A0AAE0NS38_9PEZI|nr:hypothetical protein B0H63DRAFT_467895 [Podospora didyma]
MDPLSISTACLTLLGAVGKTALAVTTFIRGCRDAGADLMSISGELTQLQQVLELLKDDTAVSDNRVLPESLQNQILSILENCTTVLECLNHVLHEHTGKTGAAKWVLFGKSKVAGLRMSLEAHRGSLNLVLALVSVSLSKAIKEDVTAIQTDVLDIQTGVLDIKQSTILLPQIMAELTRLRAIVSTGCAPSATSGQNFVLERYLDSLTLYAESVCSDVVVWDSDDDLPPPSRRFSTTSRAFSDNFKSVTEVFKLSMQLPSDKGRTMFFVALELMGSSTAVGLVQTYLSIMQMLDALKAAP